MVLVLASGRGERFVASGGTGSKLQARLGDRTVLEHTISLFAEFVKKLAATPEAGGWLVLPGDLPLVRPQSLRAVAQALQQASVVLPFYRGTRGHPVGFAREHGAALQALVGAEGAAVIVKAAKPLKLELDDEGIVTDIDTVDNLAHAQALLSKRSL